MPALVEIDGDLTQTDATIVAHQCNCVTRHAKHLAATMFAAFPHANIYAERKGRDEPGHIVLRGNGTSERYVVNLLGQRYPGMPRFDNDTRNMRIRWFAQCLQALARIPILQDPANSIAFPARIGCGAAAGDWEQYRSVLERWAENHVRAKVIIVNFAN